MVTRICDICGRPIGDQQSKPVTLGDQRYEDACPDCLSSLKAFARGRSAPAEEGPIYFPAIQPRPRNPFWDGPIYITYSR